MSAFTADAATGALTPVNRYPAGITPIAVTVDPMGKFVFVANCGVPSCDGRGPGNISVYAIDPDSGGLTEVNGSPTTG